MREPVAQRLPVHPYHFRRPPLTGSSPDQRSTPPSARGWLGQIQKEEDTVLARNPRSATTRHRAEMRWNSARPETSGRGSTARASEISQSPIRDLVAISQELSEFRAAIDDAQNRHAVLRARRLGSSLASAAHYR